MDIGIVLEGVPRQVTKREGNGAFTVKKVVRQQYNQVIKIKSTVVPGTDIMCSLTLCTEKALF